MCSRTESLISAAAHRQKGRADRSLRTAGPNDILPLTGHISRPPDDPGKHFLRVLSSYSTDIEMIFGLVEENPVYILETIGSITVAPFRSCSDSHAILLLHPT